MRSYISFNELEELGETIVKEYQHTRYDCIRQDPRFISVIEKLNLNAK